MVSQFYTSPDRIRVITSRTMQWEERVARNGRYKICLQILVAKLTGSLPLRNAKYRWENNSKIK